MRLFVFFYILMLILNLPFQTTSFFKTWSHVQSFHHVEVVHDHEHAVAHATADAEHPHHHDDPQQPSSHSHDRELWGLFSDLGIHSKPILSASLTFESQPRPELQVHELVCAVFCQGLLRPPIT